MLLLIPTYFSPIIQYAAIIKHENILFEIQDNFQKQTYRNRCYIYGANGKQLLSIPIKKGITTSRKKTKDTLVENNFIWQKQHFKSIQNSYRNSPFFEFFEDDLSKIFFKKYKFLLDINIDSFLFIKKSLELPQNFKKTTKYNNIISNDLRSLAISKKNIPQNFPEYIQVFNDKHGFIQNLSILDLLFMEGKESFSYLKKIIVNLLPYYNKTKFL